MAGIISSALENTRKTLTSREELEESFGEVSPYLPPRMDLGRLGFLTQQMAAPGRRDLRFGVMQAIQRAQRAGRASGNPTLTSLLTRGALKGYGGGLEQVLSGARREARATYLPEFQAQADAERLFAMMKFQRSRDIFGRDEDTGPQISGGGNLRYGGFPASSNFGAAQAGLAAWSAQQQNIHNPSFLASAGGVSYPANWRQTAVGGGTGTYQGTGQFSGQVKSLLGAQTAGGILNQPDPRNLLI